MFLSDGDIVVSDLKGVDIHGRPVTAKTPPLSELTTHQSKQALGAVPSNYLPLYNWSSRGHSHNTFTCPYLAVSQQICFTHRYYLHKIQQRPTIDECYKQKPIALAGKGPDPDCVRHLMESGRLANKWNYV